MATALSTGITLNLTTSEAESLYMLLSYVGGSPDTSRRGDTQAIFNALCGAGIYVPVPEAYETEKVPFTANPVPSMGPALYWKDSLETL